MMERKGKVVQILGPVIDVAFRENDSLPKILHALKLKREDSSELILECSQHLGGNVVRTIAMDSTEGLKRGLPVIDTQKPISVPVGEEIRGRLFNVVGEPIDGLPKPAVKQYRSIHQPPPPFEKLSTHLSILHTGIKVIDLLAPYV